MRIKQYDYKREYCEYANEYEKKALEVLRSGWYTLGEELRHFESEWATYNGTRNCIGVASGLDALRISLQLLGVGSGDEVILPAHTYIASALAVSMCGAMPVFADVDEYYGLDISRLSQKCSIHTKAVLAVHLYGMPCQIDRINEFCLENQLLLVEDCAQAHGAKYNGKIVGTFGQAGCFSFFPSKNLGAFGDGGSILTDDNDFAKLARKYRNYGSIERYHHDIKGINSRLDEIQAGLLRVKLSHIEKIIEERKKVAKRYMEEIKNSRIILPQIRKGAECVWHQFVVRCENRDELLQYLKEQGIETYIHYPIPPHLSNAYKDMGYKLGDFPNAEKYAKTVLSLPIYLGMTFEEQSYVIKYLNKF